MELQAYLFAFYIFVLICVAIWFYSRVMRAPRKDSKETYQREQKLFAMYQNAEDMLASVEEYTEETKAALEEKIQHMSKVMAEFKSVSERENQVTAETQKPKEATPPAKKTRATKKTTKATPKAGTPKKTTRTRKTKTLEEKVGEMADLGMETSEIAKKTGRSTKEVALIMEVKKLKG